MRLADGHGCHVLRNVRGGPCDLRFAMANVAHRQRPEEDPWPLTGLFPSLVVLALSVDTFMLPS